MACLPLKRCSAMRTVKLGHKNWTRMSWSNPFIALFCYSCLWLVSRDDVLWLHRNWAILLSARNSSLANWLTGKSNIFLFRSTCHVLAKNKFDRIRRKHEKNYVEILKIQSFYTRHALVFISHFYKVWFNRERIRKREREWSSCFWDLLHLFCIKITSPVL